MIAARAVGARGALGRVGESLVREDAAQLEAVPVLDDAVGLELRAACVPRCCRLARLLLSRLCRCGCLRYFFCLRCRHFRMADSPHGPG